MSDQINRPIDRRWFIGSSAAALGYFMTADKLTAVRAADEPSSKIRFAGVGVGGKGSGDIDQAGNIGQIVALCDIDENNLAAKLKKWPEAAKFTDYRKLLEEKGKEIDAVVVSTPDHNHAWPSIMAMRMKKHVYCQKPLTHTVFEARLMRETAKKFGVCTQMGNQGSAENGLRRGVELVQDGLLGEIKEIHVWTNRPIWPQAPGVMKRAEGMKAIPSNVHWEEFIGPAPMRPYQSGYHPFAWRGWLDFGTGALGDMACHTANMAFRACELTSPTIIEADATDVNTETYPSSAKIAFDYPKRGDKPHQAALKFYWYEGKRGGKKVLPPEELLAKVLKEKEKLADSGSIIVGSKAILFSPNDYGAQFRIIGTEVANLGKPERLPINGRGDQGMKDEWAKAIRDGKPEVAYSNFDIAGMLTEAILLGNIAIRSGKKLEFDAATLKITNDAAANLMVSKEYRKGWEITEKA
ncbi:Gfo/Idh/MocA family protein [Zavarzinella formosa]|uniref:Gfo/Idh/MocA family protein n=1 Tax=Zavarzinella formosa TaxID=360055 RepID=UPI000300DC3B|nr:Gfo/Idh/MocA family oxidoreductase [Zavarzinella formosa]